VLWHKPVLEDTQEHCFVPCSGGASVQAPLQPPRTPSTATVGARNQPIAEKNSDHYHSQLGYPNPPPTASALDCALQTP